MDRHWTLDLVALSAVLAGFVLAAVGEAAPLAGVVAALGAYALVYPDFVASSRRASPR